MSIKGSGNIMAFIICSMVALILLMLFFDTGIKHRKLADIAINKCILETDRLSARDYCEALIWERMRK